MAAATGATTVNADLNTDTSSVPESVSSDSALLLRKRRLEIQLQFVRNAKRRIDDETHPDLLERFEKVDLERDEALAAAERRHEYLKHCTSVIFEYECEEASNEFRMKCEKLRHDMLEEIHNEMEIINDQRKGVSTARKTTRKTRSTRSKTNSSSDYSSYGLETSAQKIKKKYGNYFQPLEKKLAQSEVEHDVKELCAMYEETKKSRLNNPKVKDPPFVREYHGKLLYRDLILEEGDEVLIRFPSGATELDVILCAVTSTEVFVLNEKGKYSSILLGDLRKGLVEIEPVTKSHEKPAKD